MWQYSNFIISGNPSYFYFVWCKSFEDVCAQDLYPTVRGVIRNTYVLSLFVEIHMKLGDYVGGIILVSLLFNAIMLFILLFYFSIFIIFDKNLGRIYILQCQSIIRTKFSRWFRICIGFYRFYIGMIFMFFSSFVKVDQLKR